MVERESILIYLYHSRTVEIVYINNGELEYISGPFIVLSNITYSYDIEQNDIERYFINDTFQYHLLENIPLKYFRSGQTDIVITKKK